MNLDSLNAETAKGIQRFKKSRAINSNWVLAGEMVRSLAVPKNLTGESESFIENSAVFRQLLDQINVDEISLPDMILLAQSAKAIEEGDTKAATFVRDTSGGKPSDEHIVSSTKSITDLSDEQLEFLLEHAESTDDEDDEDS